MNSVSRILPNILGNPESKIIDLESENDTLQSEKNDLEEENNTLKEEVELLKIIKSNFEEITLKINSCQEDILKYNCDFNKFPWMRNK